MRKLLVTLIILVLLGGVVFFFGWVQLNLSAGEYGVIFTKTNGWEESVVEPGSFAWRWQRLLPTNLTLYVFEPATRQTQLKLSGTLPSGRAIETLLESADAFDYEVRLTITTRIKPERLPDLARDRGLVPDELESYTAGLDEQLERLATESVLSLIEETPDRITLSDAYSGIAETVQSRLERQFAQLEIVSVSPTRIVLPDLELYQTARGIVEDVFTARADALTRAAESLAQSQAESDRELLLLERYGEILEKYPVLLEYFRVGQEIGTDPLNIESLIPQPGQ